MDAVIEQLRRPILDNFLTPGHWQQANEVRLEGEREVCQFEECAMGCLITDAMRAATGANRVRERGGEPQH